MTIARHIAARGGILVAHDGSPSSHAALLTAVRCAAAFGGHVEVVRAWDMVTAPRPSSMSGGYVPPLEDFEQATLAALERDVASVRAITPGTTIVCSVVHGGAAEKLIEASPQVEMIVLGSRGHGGFVGLLLGSTSEKVVHHAKCRVLVDRGPRTNPAESAVEMSQEMQDALASELKLGGPL